MAFSNSVVLNYPVDEVFRVFIRTAKRDFPKFNENNPIGCKVTKKIGAYSVQSATVQIEITDYKKNELYQIQSVGDRVVYTSTYEFEVFDENSTRLTLTEEDKKAGFFPWFNALIQNIAFKGRVKRRFALFAEGLERELENHRFKIEKNSKTKASEEVKVKARAEAKSAKEAARRAQEEARVAKVAAAKAIAEAKAAAEEAERAAKEADAKIDEFDEDLDEAVSEVMVECEQGTAEKEE